MSAEGETAEVAVVTGGGTGVGRAAALALAGEGFALVFSRRRPEPLNEVASEIGSTGGRAIVVPADVTDPESIRAVFTRAVEVFGRFPITSRSWRLLNQWTHSRVANSTGSRPRQGPGGRITSVLYSPMIDSAKALSYESPTLPTDCLMPASARRSV